MRGGGGLLALGISFKTTRGYCWGKRSAGEDAESGLGSLRGAALTVLVAWGCWALIPCAGYRCCCRACFQMNNMWRCTVHRHTQGFAGGGALSVLSHAVCVCGSPSGSRHRGAPARPFPFGPSFADGPRGEKCRGLVRFVFNATLGTLILW